jgi:hypothetical protein
MPQAGGVQGLHFHGVPEEVSLEVTRHNVIDPYNDFITDGGKIWDRIKGVAEADQCVPHMI